MLKSHGLKRSARRFPTALSCLLSWFLGLMITAPAMAGLVGVDRQRAPLRDWAFEQLTANREQFAQASQLYVEGKFEECHAVLARLRMTNPALPQPDLVIAWLQLSDHKLAQAKARLENLAAAVPRDPQVALTLGQIALAEGRLADAAAHLERASLLQLPEAWPVEQRASFARTTLDTLAIGYERQSRWSDAKTILSTLVSMGDQDLLFTNRLARAHYNLGELSQCEKLLKVIAERSSGALPVPLLLADLAFSSGKLDQAGEAIKQAVELHRDNAEVQMWLAEWSLMRNEVAVAEEALKLAKKLGQSSARYWISLGQCRLVQSEYGEAVEAFREAVKMLASVKGAHHTASATNLLALALISLPEGDQAAREEAVSIAEKNALAYSSDPTYVGTLGWIYFKLGRREPAEPLLQRALELSPRVSSDLSFFVADFYSGLNDRKEAAETFLNAALESSPGIFVMRPQAIALSRTLSPNASIPQR